MDGTMEIIDGVETGNTVAPNYTRPTVAAQQDGGLVERLTTRMRQSGLYKDAQLAEEAATALAEKDAQYERLASRMDAMAADNQRLRAECEGLRAERDEAAPSPSPAPGVVEKWAADREMLAEAAADTSLSDGAVRALCLAKVGEVTQEVRDWAALASISQPAKGEQP